MKEKKQGKSKADHLSFSLSSMNSAEHPFCGVAIEKAKWMNTPK
jgi:hypothetical protein